MIVTRKRKKKFPWKRVLTAAAILAVIVAVFAIPVSRAAIADRTQPVWKPFAAPFEGLALEKQIRDQSSEIASMQAQLSDAQNQIASRDKRISQMQSQLASNQDAAVQRQSVQNVQSAQPVSKPSPLPTPDVSRIAAEWSAMDSEAAAKVVQKLPVDYVRHVFAAMTPDAAGAILENLPASYAAQLSQERPQARQSKVQ
jgi:flagellar motility protein MotE (MotC chaperone)